jgi:predicted O-methyltransferase YrrM
MKTFEEVFEVTKTISSHPALEDVEVRGLWEACMNVPENGLVVEVGCQLGRSSSVILQVGKERPYHSVHIDPFLEQPEIAQQWLGHMFRAAGTDRHNLTLLCMKTEWAVWHLERLLKDGVDLAFIDGDHDYQPVMIDLMLIADKIIPRGFLVCHDYGRDSLPDVYKAVNEFLAMGNWEEIGVYNTLGVWRKL